jgi:hypothetical protein
MTRSEGTRYSASRRRGIAGAVRALRMFPMRIAGGAGAAGLVALALLVAGAPPAAAETDTSADQRQLGYVTYLAWSVRNPARERLVLQPSVRAHVEKRALRLLGARAPRVSGRFVARIVTKPARGQARTPAVVSRRVKDRAIRPSSVRRLAGRGLRLRRSVLNRRQSARVKRAAERQPLAIVARAHYRVRYTDEGGQTAVTPTRTARTVLPLSLERPRARGAKLRNLARSLRRVIVRVRRARIACVTRETIMHRLNSVYGTLVSGDRTGTADLLRVWIADARSKAAAGVLGEAHATRLRAGLREALKRVGSGRSKRLDNAPRLPRPPHCESSAGAAGAAGEPVRYQAAAISAALRIARSAFQVIRGAKTTSTVRQLKRTLWPSGCKFPCDGDSVYDLIESDKIDFAAKTLDSLADQLQGLFDAEDSFTPGKEKNLTVWGSKWISVEEDFDLHRKPTFQVTGSEIDLLPLYAQYETLYLSLLRYGVLNGPRMGIPEEYIRGGLMQDKLESRLASASKYATDTFVKAVQAKKDFSDNEKQYASKNPEWVDKRLKALDFRDAWPLQDPMAYPYGDPNFRPTRMIYSDEWGRMHKSSDFPRFGMDDKTGELTKETVPMPNVEHPLTRFTAWVKSQNVRFPLDDHFYDPNFLSAIKVDNAPLTGSVTGDSALTPAKDGEPAARFDYAVGPGSAINEVAATWWERDYIWYPQHLIMALQLNFSDGSSKVPGGTFYTYKNTSFPPGVDGDRTRFWAYPDHVLATAKIMGRHEYTNNNYTGDAIVFGFRLEDSFLPPTPPAFGRVTPPSPDDQVCLAIEQETLEGGPEFVHKGEETGKRVDVAANRGPQVQMYDCDYAGWAGTATWETTWSFNNEDSGDPQKGELTVFGGTKCAAPDPADPNAVRIQDCAGTAPQMWTPRPDGTIVNAQSGRCLERAGLGDESPVRLNDCSTPTGSTPVSEQRWSWPAGWPAQPAGG